MAQASYRKQSYLFRPSSSVFWPVGRSVTISPKDIIPKFESNNIALSYTTHLGIIQLYIHVTPGAEDGRGWQETAGQQIRRGTPVQNKPTGTGSDKQSRRRDKDIKENMS